MLTPLLKQGFRIIQKQLEAAKKAALHIGKTAKLNVKFFEAIIP